MLYKIDDVVLISPYIQIPYMLGHIQKEPDKYRAYTLSISPYGWKYLSLSAMAENLTPLYFRLYKDL